MKNKISEAILRDKSDITDIARRMLRRDFSGYTGIALKNSIFQLTTTLLSRLGAFLFTVLLAGDLITVKVLGFEKPLLSQELFGLYSLTLSTIFLIGKISDIGIGNTFIRFVSWLLEKKDYKKAKLVGIYLFNMRLIFIGVSVIVLLCLSRFLAESYYKKPIYLALLAGGIYIILNGIIGIIDSSFISQNNFKFSLIKETVFQALRVFIVPIAIVYSLGYSEGVLVMSIIFALVFCAFLSGIIAIIFNIERFAYLRTKTGKVKIDEIQKRRINKFILAIFLTSLSGMFLSYIDILFLGRFVSAESIGYYRVGISLISSAIPLIGFSSVLLPIFSRLRGNQIKKALHKSIRLMILLTIPTTIISIIIAKDLIFLVYGRSYVSSVLIFQIFASLILIDPIIAIYSNFHISQNRPFKVTRAILSSTFVNLVLSGMFVFYLIGVGAGEYFIVLGVTLATIISKISYLIILLKKT